MIAIKICARRRSTLPNRIVLFVIGTAAVTWQPLQCNGRLGSVGRDVVRRMRLSALDHQVSGRHYCGHLVARDAVIIPEIGFPEVLYCDVPAVDAVTTLGQRRSVPLRTQRKAIDESAGRATHTRNIIESIGGEARGALVVKPLMFKISPSKFIP